MEQAKSLLFEGDIDAGIERLQSLARTPERNYWLGRAIHRQWLIDGSGDLVAAHQYLARAIEGDPSNASCWGFLARTLDDLGNSAAAIVCYLEALRLDPQHVFSQCNLAIHAATVGMPKAQADLTYLLETVSEAAFERARQREWWLTSWPEFRVLVETNLALARYYECLSLPDNSPLWAECVAEVIACCERALESIPDDEMAVHLLQAAEDLLRSCDGKCASA